MINVTKSIILSKIDYGLVIYGKCAKSYIRPLQSTYHAAIRASLKAFKTSPIINILAEGGFSSIEERKDVLTSRLVGKILESYDSPILSDCNKILKRSKTPKKPSALYITLMFARKIGIEIKIKKKDLENHPPWLLLSESINTDLARFKKDSTPNVVYLQHFHELLNPLIENNWIILFTDGSKCEEGTSFAIVDANNNLLSSERLPSFFSIFSAEALAVLKATQIVSKSKKKTVICSDSLSTLAAIKNVNNRSPFTGKIRDNIIKLGERMKIFWVPGHIGVKGNEDADYEAKITALNINQAVSQYQPTKKRYI